MLLNFLSRLCQEAPADMWVGDLRCSSQEVGMERGVREQIWQDLVMAYGRRGNKEKSGIMNPWISGILSGCKMQESNQNTSMNGIRLQDYMETWRGLGTSSVTAFLVSRKCHSWHFKCGSRNPVSSQGSTEALLRGQVCDRSPEPAITCSLSPTPSGLTTPPLSPSTSQFYFLLFFTTSWFLFAFFSISLSHSTAVHSFSIPSLPHNLKSQRENVWLVQSPQCWPEVSGKASHRSLASLQMAVFEQMCTWGGGSCLHGTN